MCTKTDVNDYDWSGDTGKSTLLNIITKTFEQRGVGHQLAKTAISGKAATVVGGMTLHWCGGVPVMKTLKGDE